MCNDDEGLSVHGNLPHRFLVDSILAGDLFGERVQINPPKELADEIGQDFENFSHTTFEYTLAIFVLPKWSKFNKLTHNWKMSPNFPTRMQMFT
jgi:hypothetical protein